MARSLLKTPNRERKILYYWIAEVEDAESLQSDFYFQESLATYELMEVVWPGEKRIADLRDHIVHWEEQMDKTIGQARVSIETP